MPKAAVPPSTSRGLAREMVAETRAPMRAPAPKQAVTIPKTSGPDNSVCFASTGSRTLKLNESVVTSRTVASSTPASGTRRTNANASLLPRNERRALVALGREARAPPA